GTRAEEETATTGQESGSTTAATASRPAGSKTAAGTTEATTATEGAAATGATEAAPGPGAERQAGRAGRRRHPSPRQAARQAGCRGGARRARARREESRARAGQAARPRPPAAEQGLLMHALLVALVLAGSDPVVFEAQVSNDQINFGDTVQLTIQVSTGDPNAHPRYTPPDLPDFEIVSFTPQQSTQWLIDPARGQQVK